MGEDIMENDVQRKLNEKLASLQEIQRDGTTLDLAYKMQHWFSTKPVDKVVGLVYLLQMDSILVYDSEQSEADAWEALMDAMEPRFRAELLFFFPEPGNGSKYWWPSWEQVMTSKLIMHNYAWYPNQVYWSEDPDADFYEGHCIKSGNMWGLSEVLYELKPRQGELVLNDATGVCHTIEIVADHAYPIPDGLYTLIGCIGKPPRSDLWVAGQLTEDGTFKKLSVFHSADNEQVKLMNLALEE
ncbi:hypothetical protein F5146DRAFT_1137061 [Armillaria mellea]|nr:hypothetical protein F5146DRAFT_1137061 [Armillaria mellea]